MCSKKYKIALVCDWFFPRVGGVEIQIKNLAHRLIQAGQEVHVITGTPGSPEIEGIRVHRLKIPLWPRVQVAFERKAVRGLRSVLQKEKFNLIHGHSVFSPLAHIAIILGREMGIPTVNTNHSLMQGTPSNRATTFLYRYIVSTIGSLCLGRVVRPHEATADVMTAVSQAVAKHTSRLYRCNDVRVLPNGISSKEWQISFVENPRFRITCVSRFYPTKKIFELARLIPKIYEKLPLSVRPLFTLVGDGPEMKRIKKEITKNDLMDDVELTGYLSQAKIRELFSKTDLFVLPAYKEGFGIAVLEARTAGLPVVAMNHGGIADVLKHGYDGFLANTYEEFQHYVVNLVLDHDLRKNIRTNAENPIPHFEWDHVVGEHLKIYKLAIERLEQRK